MYEPDGKLRYKPTPGLHTAGWSALQQVMFCRLVACLLCEAKSQDCLKHDQTGREEVEAHCTVAVVSQEGHEEAESNKDHDGNLQHGVEMVWEGKICWPGSDLRVSTKI